MITNLTLIIAALLLTEADGRTNRVVGDGGRAVGPLQEWECTVDEANRILKHKAYTYNDRYDLEKSKEIAAVVLTYWAPRRNCKTAADIGCLHRNPDGHFSKRYRARFIDCYRRVTHAKAAH
jgi:hypothetical protein